MVASLSGATGSVSFHSNPKSFKSALVRKVALVLGDSLLHMVASLSVATGSVSIHSSPNSFKIALVLCSCQVLSAFLELSCLAFVCELLTPGLLKSSCCRPVTSGPLGEWIPMSGSSVFSVAVVEPSLEPASTENPPTVGWIVHFRKTSFSKSSVAWEEASLFLFPP